jgi:hypothetical protein
MKLLRSQFVTSRFEFTSPNKSMSRPEGNCTFILLQNDISQMGDFSEKETKL